MSAGPKTRAFVGLLFVISVAAFVRIVNLDHEPTSDELYHLLAAESWVNSGTFAIGDGEYPRASVFTRLVGLVHAATDGDLYWIRMFCVVIGVLSIIAVYLSVNRWIGNSEALIASLMLALMPSAIYLSQFIRFYSLHALTFWCAAMTFYFAVTEKGYRAANRFFLAAISVLLFAFSAELQKTTYIGMAGIGAWLILSAIPSLLARVHELSRRDRVFALGIAIFFTVVFTLVFYKPAAGLVADFLWSPLWSSETPAAYYALRYRDQFGVFWIMFPVAAILALAVRPKPAFFCCCVFAVSFVLHSFAGMKSERYMFYAMPFFVTTWGIALTAAVGYCNGFVSRQLDRIDVVSVPESMSKVLPKTVTGLIVAWIVLMTPATDISVRMMLDKPPIVRRFWFSFTTSWRDAQQTINTLVERSDVFLTSQGHHAYYYVGDFDVEISATGLSDFHREGGTDIDPRTGRRVIADVDSLRNIHACNQSGVVVIHEKAWRHFAGVRDELADYFERHMTKVDTPSDWGMHIYVWPAGESNMGFEDFSIENQVRNCAG